MHSLYVKLLFVEKYYNSHMDVNVAIEVLFVYLQQYTLINLKSIKEQV